MEDSGVRVSVIGSGCQLVDIVLDRGDCKGELTYEPYNPSFENFLIT